MLSSAPTPCPSPMGRGLLAGLCIKVCGLGVRAGRGCKRYSLASELMPCQALSPPKSVQTYRYIKAPSRWEGAARRTLLRICKFEQSPGNRHKAFAARMLSSAPPLPLPGGEGVLVGLCAKICGLGVRAGRGCKRYLLASELMLSQAPTPFKACADLQVYESPLPVGGGLSLCREPGAKPQPPAPRAACREAPPPGRAELCSAQGFAPLIRHLTAVRQTIECAPQAEPRKQGHAARPGKCASRMCRVSTFPL